MDKPYTDEQIRAAILLDGLTEVSAADGRLLRTFKRLLVGMTVAVLVLAVAVVALIAVVASRSHDDKVQSKVDQAVAEQAAAAARVDADTAECRSHFTNRIADLAEAKFDASMDIIKEEGRVIIETAAVHPPAPFDPAPIFKALAASDKASADYDTGLAQRNDWTKAGEPLPCPIKPPGG